MYLFPEVLKSSRIRDVTIFFCQTKINLQSYLIDKEEHKFLIQIKQPFRSAVHYFEKFILIIFEICRCTISRHYRPLMLLEPWCGIIHLDFRYGKFMRASLMNNRKVQGLYSVCRIYMTAVTVRLFLVVFTRFDINDRRRQFCRTVSVASVCQTSHLLSNGRKIGYRRKICR